MVVAIIALLISILLPSLSAAREQARTVRCAANLKTWGLAQQMYANEEDGFAVPFRLLPAQDNVKWFYNAKFHKLLGGEYDNYGDSMNPDILCPSMPDNAISEGYTDIRSYGMNYSDIDDASGNPASGTQGYKLVNIKSPSEKFNFIDANWWAPKYNRADYANTWDIYGEGNAGDVWVTYRHQEGANVLLHDGHVQYYTKQEAYDLNNDEIKRMWLLGE